MHAALLLLAASYLANSEEPPLAPIPPAAADVQKLPVGDPVSAPAAMPSISSRAIPAMEQSAPPVAEQTAIPVTTNAPQAVTTNAPQANRIVPMPAETYEQPAPRRQGFFRGLFHKNSENYPQEVTTTQTTGSCACQAQTTTMQSAPAPSHRRFGWLHNMFHGSESNGNYVQDGQGVVISSSEGTTMP
jgi:hypothetical protein